MCGASDTDFPCQPVPQQAVTQAWKWHTEAPGETSFRGPGLWPCPFFLAPPPTGARHGKRQQELAPRSKALEGRSPGPSHPGSCHTGPGCLPRTSSKQRKITNHLVQNRVFWSPPHAARLNPRICPEALPQTFGPGSPESRLNSCLP